MLPLCFSIWIHSLLCLFVRSPARETNCAANMIVCKFMARALTLLISVPFDEVRVGGVGEFYVCLFLYV